MYYDEQGGGRGKGGRREGGKTERPDTHQQFERSYQGFRDQPDKHTHSVSRNATSLPVLVEAPFALVAQVLSKDGFESSQTTWCLDVANHADTHNGRSLDNGDRLDNLVLMTLCCNRLILKCK